MKDRSKKTLLILGLFFMTLLLGGCAEEKVEDNGELIQKPPAQIEMYI